jgi:type II secretory pathway pseudopilin PulG
MKTVFAKPLKNAGDSGFTLLDLLVVIGVIAILFIIQLPAWARGKSQTKIGICAGHARQLALSCQMYASDNNNHLPVLSGGASWAWDVPAPVTDALLRYGLATNTFYCPGTAPRFTDKQNWSSPTLGSSLWNFSSTYHIVGYAFAFSRGLLATTNQNTTMLPEPITLAGAEVVPPASERVLVGMPR